VPFPDDAVPAKSDDHVALWVARMQAPKDPLLAIDAWPAVVRAVPDARLVLCGTGPLLAQVRRRAAASPVASHIEVRGFVDDLEPLRRSASLYVLATRVEGGTTMATLEAMTRGLVPVVSDAGDAFLYEHARAGVVVQPGSARALAAAVVDLWHDPDRLAAMRERALEMSRHEWTTDDMVAETLSFYRELLGRRSP
jgi:glycosyltransferase involved in cell wall biosynthesis